MNLPILTEIEIDDFEILSLIETFRAHEVGKRPCFIELNLSQKKYIKPALDNVMTALEMIAVDPRFPYPLYIVSPHIKKFLDLPIIDKCLNLPAHFKSKSGRLNNKEQSLLRKSHLLATKISNNRIDNITDYIHSEKYARRMLVEICQEIEFLESISDGLQKTKEY